MEILNYIVKSKLWPCCTKCPVPRNMISAMASRILNVTSINHSIDELPDYEVAEKLEAINKCTDEGKLHEKVSDFQKRFSMGFNKPTVSIEDKETLCESITYHNCISVCLEEIKAVSHGLSMLSVLDVLENHMINGMKELMFSENIISAQEFLKMFNKVEYCKLEGYSIDTSKMKEGEEGIVYNFTNCCLNALEARESQDIEVIDIDIMLK